MSLALEPRSTSNRIAYLEALERKVLWLAVWMIHHANHLREKRDGLKVGGHQASSASVATLMTALYFGVLRPEDRVAVKPHASPVFHAIQYLLGRQTRERLERFRSYGGAQAYPSRTKDADDVDFSTGSVGLGVAMTCFSSLVRDYLRAKDLIQPPAAQGRMIAIGGDAEFDEGNVFEALFEGWKQGVRNLWWIVDYNRQSLDTVIPDRFFTRIDDVFRVMEWRVDTLKYGSLLRAAFERRGGDALREWIDECPNARYSALSYKGGPAWRAQLQHDLGDTSGIRELLDDHDEAMLQRLMTNLGGHDLPTILDAFHRASSDDQPTCFIAYTIKGFNLPFAGHKDNHAGQMTGEQIAHWRDALGIRAGDEWEPFAGLDLPHGALRAFVDSVPFAASADRRYQAARVSVPDAFDLPRSETMSTQQGFGRLLADIAREHQQFADRVVTTTPDVTVSTSLGGWVNRRGVFGTSAKTDAFREAQIASPQQWTVSPGGQHIELGIAESNLFLLLASLGLSHSLFGARLLPIGAVYDPFVSRGLDALNYACYQDARFLLVGTPAGVALAPEGGAHQSVYTPLIGIGQPGLLSYEPAFVDELAEITKWAFDWMQQPEGEAVYLRLSTRPVAQPPRTIDASLRTQLIAGAYWLETPAEDAELAIVASGATVPEALDACRELREDVPGIGLLVVTSADRLHRDWLRSQSGDGGVAAIERALECLPRTAGLISVLDGHPATLSWLGAVRGHRIAALGVSRFGQSGDIPDLFRVQEIDADAIITAAARLLAPHRR